MIAKFALLQEFIEGQPGSCVDMLKVPNAEPQINTVNEVTGIEGYIQDMSM